jgi:hypothetical protein
MDKSKRHDRKERDDRRDRHKKKNKRLNSSDSEESDNERRSKDHKISKRGKTGEGMKCLIINSLKTNNYSIEKLIFIKDESNNNANGGDKTEKTELSIEETK